MESLIFTHSSRPLLQTHSTKLHKLTSTTSQLFTFHNATPFIPNQTLFLKKSNTQYSICSKNPNFIKKIPYLSKTTSAHVCNPQKNSTFMQKFLNPQKSIPFLTALVCMQFPSFAIETTLPTEQVSSDKINLESILISIDDFFNRYPFFVAGCTFIWLVVIPLTEEYLKKCKFISANDAFRKLSSDPSSQLLDIRDKQSLVYLDSPNIKILDKRTVQVGFKEGEEEGFVKKVLENFSDPGNTAICVLDNFDGDSMKVAELLFQRGFKEAYAIKGGLRGTNGWLEIQETLLPPSMHVFPKKGKTSKQVQMSGKGTSKPTKDNGQAPSSSVPANSSTLENVHVGSTEPTTQANLGSSRSSSPYPNYPDMKPPSSPTPSKPLT